MLLQDQTPLIHQTKTEKQTVSEGIFSDSISDRGKVEILVSERQLARHSCPSTTTACAFKEAKQAQHISSNRTLQKLTDALSTVDEVLTFRMSDSGPSDS
ncbi:hypothetical protein MPTK1_3g10373 [Marchantia polymorpha subsp. ruderalis]